MASKHRLIKWYKDKQGLVSYSKENRGGPHSYDSAGAMFSALIYADYLPQHSWIGDLSLLLHLEGSLLHCIDYREVRRGDIFISTDPDQPQIGYTGVVIDRHRMIYCSEEYDGIVISKFRTWPSQELYWYRLAEPVRKQESFLEKLEQWLNRYNRRRALQAVNTLDLSRRLNQLYRDINHRKVTD
ncbi:peptidoglycan amidohydrolase family protein [Ignavigranum ruoffiae]|uniref:peptidoglycan amidohydrolase family protein n=1 Tax=Ignavigranum ruoffiae TaxID=89093 RepID=UPI0024AE2649|nr:peptidoglycan amidohydrolase family protein [Ignavigranum ruoffiae]